MHPALTRVACRLTFLHPRSRVYVMIAVVVLLTVWLQYLRRVRPGQPDFNFFGGYWRTAYSHKARRTIVDSSKRPYWPPFISLQTERGIDLAELPTRKIMIYHERTPSNPRTDPWGVDFGLFVSHTPDQLVLFEDHGPGCLHRFYDYDQWVEFEVTRMKVASIFLHVVLDNTSTVLPYHEVYEAKRWPFLHPMASRHASLSGGANTLLNTCYAQFARISFIHNRGLSNETYAQAVRCAIDGEGVKCPIKKYFAVSYTKPPRGMEVPLSLNDQMSLSTDIASDVRAGRLMTVSGCRMDCGIALPRQHIVILHQLGTGSIKTLRFRAYDELDQPNITMLHGVLLSIWVDSHKQPFVRNVSLGMITGVGRINPYTVNMIANGVATLHCEEHGSASSVGLTACFGFPIVYRSEVRIQLHSTFNEVIRLCFQHIVDTGPVDTTALGYLHAEQTYFSAPLSVGWKRLVRVEGRWGHVVMVMAEDVNVDHGIEEADPRVYIDDQMSATVMGTGLEDYFSCAHHCNRDFSPTSSVSGVVSAHGSSWRNEKISRQYFRLHLFDPIIFHKSITFEVEDLSATPKEAALHVYTAAPASNRDDFEELRRAGHPGLTFLIVFYASDRPGMQLVDTLLFSSEESRLRRDLTYRLDSVQTLHFHNQVYIGATPDSAAKSGECWLFQTTSCFSFRFPSTAATCRGLLLRREYLARVGYWNQAAKLIVDGYDAGVWFVPFGALSDSAALKMEDVLLSCGKGEHLSITICPQTDWCDISYQLFLLQ